MNIKKWKNAGREAREMDEFVEDAAREDLREDFALYFADDLDDMSADDRAAAIEAALDGWFETPGS